MTYAVGQQVHGHRLLEKVGEGAFGDVWRADYLGQTVAIKILRRKIRSENHELFAQYALGRLAGPDARFFPRIEHVELEADPAYIRMELIEGRPLEDLIHDPALPLARRLEIGARLLEALDAVHRHGFVHGDLSPANVLVDREGGVKLIDVGFGRVLEDGSADIVSSSTAEEHEKLGVASPLYAAPERFRSDFGTPADVFSFGKVLYRLITGESPFVVKPVTHRFPTLGSAWDDFVFRCLEERPGDRFADGGAALARYREICRPVVATGGEFRAACVRCRRDSQIPGGWAGERFGCRHCGAQLEVLFYDDEKREAVTDFVMSFEEEPEVVEAEVVERARKFCPACGASILADAKKCRYCAAMVDEVARRISRKMPRPAPAAPPRSFVGAALLTFLAYFAFWIPGAVLNLVYWCEARRVARETKREPEGLLALQVMAWILFFLPAGFVALALLVGLVAARAG